jgi:hypothetical protein
MAMEVRNTAKRPLKVPLPGGKRLFLGIGGSGQITPKSAEHPPVKKLIEAGELEITDSSHAGVETITGQGGQVKSSSARGGSQSSRQTGDR